MVEGKLVNGDNVVVRDPLCVIRDCKHEHSMTEKSPLFHIFNAALY